MHSIRASRGTGQMQGRRRAHRSVKREVVDVSTKLANRVAEILRGEPAKLPLLHLIPIAGVGRRGAIIFGKPLRVPGVTFYTGVSKYRSWDISLFWNLPLLLKGVYVLTDVLDSYGWLWENDYGLPFLQLTHYMAGVLPVLGMPSVVEHARTYGFSVKADSPPLKNFLEKLMDDILMISEYVGKLPKGIVENNAMRGPSPPDALWIYIYYRLVGGYLEFLSIEKTRFNMKVKIGLAKGGSEITLPWKAITPPRKFETELRLLRGAEAEIKRMLREYLVGRFTVSVALRFSLDSSK